MIPTRTQLNGCEVTCRDLQPADYPAAKEIISESFRQAIRANPEALEVLEQEPWYAPGYCRVQGSGSPPDSWAPYALMLPSAAGALAPSLCALRSNV